MSNAVPKIVISRLPLYLRTLEFMIKHQKSFISSQDLSRQLGVSSAQIRKDLSHFGEFGKQGTGYNVIFLRNQLQRILQVDQRWSIAVVGAGDLGHALVNYPGFRDRNFDVKAIFDIAPDKIGTTIGHIPIKHPNEIPTHIKTLDIKIAVIAVPAHAAQPIADLLIKADIRAILNYAPITLTVPSNVTIENIDPIIALQSMTYYLERENEEEAT